MAADGSMGSKGSFSADDVYRAQRTEAGKRYERMIGEHRAKSRGTKASDAEYRARRDAEVAEMRTVNPGSVHTNTFMSNLSVQYKNDDYIGLELMPLLPVTKRSDTYVTYAKRDRIGTAFDDTMSNSSETPEIGMQGRTEATYQVRDYGAADFIPAATVSNEDPGFDEMLDLTEGILEIEAFKNEVRIATALTTGANYSGNTVALSGSDKWDSSTGGDPLGAILSAIANCWSGRGAGDLVGFCSLPVWNVLAKHPQMLDLFKYTAPGMTKMDRLAAELGLSRILVGAARKDTANPGQAASYSRVWSNDFGVVRVARRPSLRNACFGYNIRMANHPFVSQTFDPDKGVEGIYKAKVGISEVARVIAGDTSYLVTACIA